MAAWLQEEAPACDHFAKKVLAGVQKKRGTVTNSNAPETGGVW